MTKLKVKFKRLGGSILMKVVQQDDSTRNTLLFKHDDFTITSVSQPGLRVTKMFVRGTDKTMDNEVVSINFASADQAKRYIRKALECIEAYNEQVQNRWVPGLDQSYFFALVKPSSGLYCEVGIWQNDVTDKYYLRINNVFKTSEECERSIEITNKKLELSAEYSKDKYVANLPKKYFISYDLCEDRHYILDVCEMNSGETYFATTEKANEFFNFCGADDYKKYVLGVY